MWASSIVSLRDLIYSVGGSVRVLQRTTGLSHSKVRDDSPDKVSPRQRGTGGVAFYDCLTYLKHRQRRVEHKHVPTHVASSCCICGSMRMIFRL